MKTTTKLLLILVLVCSTKLSAQSKDLPKNPEVGKCYEKVFDVNETYGWKAVDCNKVQKNKNEKFNTQSIVEAKALSEKIKKYQAELIKAGYNVTINGKLDPVTINAHHSYLKERKKAERRERRKNKRSK